MGLDAHLTWYTARASGLVALALWADSYVHLAWREMFVPLASSWRPGAVAWGIVATYLLLAIELTS